MILMAPNGHFLTCRRQYHSVGERTRRHVLTAYTAPYAQALRYESDLRLGRDLDAKLAGPDNGARFLAFLAAFLQTDLAMALYTDKLGFPTLGLH